VLSVVFTQQAVIVSSYGIRRMQYKAGKGAR